MLIPHVGDSPSLSLSIEIPSSFSILCSSPGISTSLQIRHGPHGHGPDAAAGTGRLDADGTGRLQQQRGFTKGVACRQLGHHLLIACQDHPELGSPGI